MFDELITAAAFPHLIWAGHLLLEKSSNPSTPLLLVVSVSVSLARS